MATKKLGSVKAVTAILVTSVDLAADVGATILPVANGGTGSGSFTDGQLLIGNTTGNTLTKATLTQGSGISITNGSGSITIAATGSSTRTISAKTGNYTIVAGDAGAIISFSGGSYTATLTAAATVGSGFACWVWNQSTSNTHSLTIDPNGAETIDGTSTLVLRPLEGVELVCNGTAWITGDGTRIRGIATNALSSHVRPSAAGTGATAIGPNSTASGSNGFAVSGASSTGQYATAINISGNVNSTASGNYSFATQGGDASGVMSVAFGEYSTTRSISGMWARSNGRITTTGDAQNGQYPLRGQTTSATPKVLTTDNAAAGTTNQVVLPNNSCYWFTATIVGHRTDVVGTRVGYKIEGMIVRGANAASTAILGTNVITTHHEDDATFDATATADATNGALAITVTGAASKTVTWSCLVETVEATS